MGAGELLAGPRHVGLQNMPRVFLKLLRHVADEGAVVAPMHANFEVARACSVKALDVQEERTEGKTLLFPDLIWENKLNQCVSDGSECTFFSAAGRLFHCSLTSLLRSDTGSGSLAFTASKKKLYADYRRREKAQTKF